MDKRYTMIHSGLSSQLFQWSTITNDCRITVVHNSSSNFWIAKLWEGPHIELHEGDVFNFEGGDRVKLYDPGDGALVVKIEVKTNTGEMVESDGSILAGSNVNRVCSSSVEQILWRSAPVGVKLKIMMSEGWQLHFANDVITPVEGDVIWTPGNTPIGFHTKGDFGKCFMYDILAFENTLKRREPLAPEDSWSCNYNYNETLNVSHSINWAFQFYNEEPFLLEDGMKVDIDCGRKYRLMKSDPNLPMTDFSGLFKYRDIEVTDHEWGQKNLECKDTQ